MKSLLTAAAPIALVAMAAPVQAQQASAQRPVPVSELAKSVDIPFESFTLANGLRVIVHTDRKAPVVAVSIWYDVGSKMEPKGKTGFAHLFEHLMFNGSENAPGDYFEPLQQMGATDMNGTTWFDRTNYYQTVPTPALERALFLESDRMGWLLGAVTQENLDNQRSVVQNEKRQADNSPYGMVSYARLEGLFPEGHPYRHSTIGSMADLDAATLDDVKQWFIDHYGPNNAVLVLAGDIDAKAAKPLVEKYFGSIKPSLKAKDPVAPVPTLDAPKKIVLKDRVANTRISRNWVVPGLNDPEVPALDVGVAILGGLASSRLDNLLVRKEQLAVSVSAGVQEFEQVSMVMVNVNVRPGVDVDLVEKRLDAIIADLIANGPTADEVTRVATSEVANRIRGLEKVGDGDGKAAALAEGALYSNNPENYKKRLAITAAQTPATVKAALAKWLSRPSLSIKVEPGARDAYVEAGAATAAAKPAAQTAQVTEAAKQTRTPPEIGDIKSVDFPKVSRTHLKNGVELVYAQRTTVPVTQVSLSFDAGGVADSDDKPGTQLLTLSMLTEGTKRHNSVEIAEIQERLGASISTGSTADRTILSLNALSPNLAASLDLLADVARNPAFDPNEVTRLKNQQLARIASEATDPQGTARRAAAKLIYAGTPYSKLSYGSGDAAAVGKLGVSDLVAFHNAWIRPDKMKVFVVSDRPLDEVKAALDQRFGDWKPVGAPGVKAFQPGKTPSRRILLLDRPDSPQSIVYGGFLTDLAPSVEKIAFTAANDVVGGSFLSRINMDLRETKGWSYGVGSGVQNYEHAVGYVVVAPVQADRTGDAIKALEDNYNSFLGDKGITPAEFERTINGATRELPGSFETAGAVLSALQQNDMLKRPDDYYATVAQKYNALTREQLDAAARGTLSTDRFVWVVVGDAAKVRGQLDSLNIPVEVIAASPAVAGDK